MVDRRTRAYWTYAMIAWVGATGLMVLPFVVLGRPTGDAIEGGRILLTTGCAALAMAWCFGFAIQAFRNADEFQRESNKVAWMWGGLAGLAVSVIAYVFIMMGGLQWLDPSRSAGRDLGRAFGEGYGLAVFSQLVGFLVVLTWWKASKR